MRLSLREAGDGAPNRAPDGGARVEVLAGPTGRRRWPDDFKARIAAESFQPGTRVCDVTAKYGLIARHLSGWRGPARQGELVVPIDTAPTFVPLVIEPLADIAASAGTGVIRVEICGAVLHVTPDCSPDRAAALAAALRKVL
ncbi:MAG: transposase [Paracoccus sp. (in: a-proteobacteria)]|uniref:transposase n=1 Tax=Paracoccus sp. TaxID=267 RepID=UPI0039E31BC0